MESDPIIHDCEAFERWLRGRQLEESTIRTYVSDLKRLSRDLGTVIGPATIGDRDDADELADRFADKNESMSRKQRGTGMKGAIRMALTGAVLGLGGCAGPITHMPDASPKSVQRAQAEFRHFDATKERQVGRSEAGQLAAVERVRQRVFPAAQRVCERFFSHGCVESLQSMRVVVYTNSPEVNAFAAQTGELGIYGGLVLESGTDDELAMVLAHEVAHIMYGHNEKASRNTGGGMLLGAAIGLALGAATYQPGMDTSYIGDIAESGMHVGGGIGAVAYSPEMELEADHFAAFVLKEASYDPRKGGRFIVRALEAGKRRLGSRTQELRVVLRDTPRGRPSPRAVAGSGTGHRAGPALADQHGGGAHAAAAGAGARTQARSDEDASGVRNGAGRVPEVPVVAWRGGTVLGVHLPEARGVARAHDHAGQNVREMNAERLGHEPDGT